MDDRPAGPGRPPGPRRDEPDPPRPVDITIELPADAPPRSTDLQDVEQRAVVERSLASVPGVLAARLVPGDTQHVDELHVLTAPGGDPRRTVRDVRTALLVRFGVTADARVVSAVPLVTRPEGAADPPPTIAHVSVEEHGDRVTAEVGLRDRARLRTATAHGEATPPGRRGAVAAATIESVRAAATELRDLDLHSVEVLEFEDHRTVVALVTDRRADGDRAAARHDGSATPTGRDEVPAAFVGTSLVGGSVDDAVAHAVFDALSRAVSRWPS